MSGAVGIYGIKRITTGFDNFDLDLFSDYYGGGSGHYLCICVDMYTVEVVDGIVQLMINTLKIAEVCNENTVIIAEWV